MNINVKDRFGSTPLMLSTASQNSLAIDFLLDPQHPNPLKVDDKNISGQTALMKLVQVKQKDFLMEFKAKIKCDTEIKDKQGQTANDMAKTQNNQVFLDVFSGDEAPQLFDDITSNFSFDPKSAK